MTGPLDDLTVLEIASWVAAPSCGALMADMGADVIKVEPLTGDGMRHKLRQPSAPEGAAAHDFPFQLDNRGKRSLAVDLAAEAGRELVAELASKADVVLTNLLPRRLARYGLDPERLHATNPGLVFGLVTGYGSLGDDADLGGFDLTAFFGRSGIMSLVGEPDGPPPAFRPGQGDHPTGLALLSGVLAALRERDRTGRGQVVETNLLHSGAWSIGCDVQVALIDRTQPNRRARNDTFSPMNTHYRCADGRWLTLAAQDQRKWSDLCDAIGRADLATDERFATPKDRYRNRAVIIAELDAVFAAEPLDHWRPLLNQTGIIWAPVVELPELIEDPQARANGMFVEVEHPEAGTFETLAAPFRLGDSEVKVRGPAPSLGDHSADVLAQFGIPGSRVNDLAEAGIIPTTTPPPKE